jgi:hypothetical protein
MESQIMDQFSSLVDRVRSMRSELPALELSTLNDRLHSLSIEWKSVALIVTGIWFISFIVRHVISYRRLRAFDGPFWAAVTQLWLFQKTAQGVVNTEMRKITEKYGKYFRLLTNSSQLYWTLHRQ